MVLGLLLAFVAACAGTPAANHNGSPKIVLLYVSDLHSQLVANAQGLGGYSRLMTLVGAERAMAGSKTDVILVMGGDLFGKGRLPCRKTNEVACAPLLGLMKPDVVSFGNGELKIPQTDLQALAKQVGGVWVGTNVESHKKQKPFWQPSYLYVGAKSGIHLNFISSSVFPGPGEALGASQIDFSEISLSYGELFAKSNAGLQAANMLILHDDIKRLDEISASVCPRAVKPLLVLKAHEHKLDSGKRDCMKYVEAGAYGTHIVRIEISGTNQKYVVDNTQTIELNEKIAKDVAMEARIESLYKNSGHGAKRVMIKLDQDLSQERVARFLALAYQKTSKADIAIVNSGAIKSGLLKGQIDWEDVLFAVPYNNELKGLDWSAADLEKSLCAAAKRPMDRRLDNGSELVLAGAELRNAGSENCRLIVDGNQRNPKVVVDSYMVIRSARWLGKELKGKTFSYGLDTERALELGIERHGSKAL